MDASCVFSFCSINFSVKLVEGLNVRLYAAAADVLHVLQIYHISDNCQMSVPP